jgi:hypothetical protein
MHELSSAERNTRYRIFFESLNNTPGLYQNLFAASVLLNRAQRFLDQPTFAKQPSPRLRLLNQDTETV